MGRTRRQLQGDQSREKIFKAAAEAFGTYGYKGSSLALIAERAGITQPGLLHHFRSKAELLLQLAGHHFEEDDVWFPAMPRYRSLDFIDLLADMIRVETDNRDATQLFYVLASESVLQDHPTHEFFVERYRRVRELLRRAIRNGQYAGRIDESIDDDRLARLVVAVLDGLVLQWLLDPELDMSEPFQLFGDLLKRSIGKPAPAGEHAAVADADG